MTPYDDDVTDDPVYPGSAAEALAIELEAETARRSRRRGGRPDMTLDYEALRAAAAQAAWPDTDAGDGRWGMAPVVRPRPPAPPASDHRWKQHAACASMDPNMFHPRHDTPPRRSAAIDAAKAVCRQCPVTAECLALALSVGSRNDYGIYGGTTPSERRALRTKGAA